LPYDNTGSRRGCILCTSYWLLHGVCCRIIIKLERRLTEMLAVLHGQRRWTARKKHPQKGEQWRSGFHIQC
jgi:hypothetical protein